MVTQMNVQNIFSRIPAELPEELTEILVSSEHVCIERIVSRGHSSPDGFWYDQRENEWVIVLQGSGCIAFVDGTVHELHSGDWLMIPAHVKHRVAWTAHDTDTIWLAVFSREIMA